jgi:site-specific recombinase XerD
LSDILVKSWTFALRAEGLSPGTISNYTREVRRFSHAMAGQLLTATSHDCRAFIAARQEVSPFSANMAWRSLRSFYRWCAAEEECGDITTKIRQPKMPVRPAKSVTREQYIRLMTFTTGQGWVGTRDAAIFGMLWDTGLRRSELAALTIEDVSIEQQSVLVRQGKNGDFRIAYIATSTARGLLSWLRARRKLPQAQNTTALWVGKFGPMSSDGIRQMIERRAKAADIDVSAHCFRRSLAERWLMNGGQEGALMSVAGWKNSATPPATAIGPSRRLSTRSWDTWPCCRSVSSAAWP